MLTIRCSQVLEFITKRDLVEVMLWLKMNIDHMRVYAHVYENSGKYKQLHMHTIVSVDRSFSYRRFTCYGDIKYNKSFHIDWTKIQDIEGAYHYLLKDLWYKEQEETLIYNIYNNHYFNIDTQNFEFLAKRETI